MNRKTVDQVLKQYFGDKETAKKFAEAMRKGLKERKQ
jgi:hypothetical protein